MTERKPPGMSTQDWVELQIRQAQQRGEFENLSGEGKPIPKLADAHDPDWWVKDFLRREKIEADVLLPPSVQLRKEKAQVAEKVARMRTETEVRDYLADLNERIRIQIRDATGAVIPVGFVDTEAVVEQWHRDRPAPPPGQSRAGHQEHSRRRRKSVWQRLFS
ncbi:conserved hypothetical protein [Kribbella flavida DSM 17836]|uniref:DnaJ homologue subfamily C member 28 conserved domain-containing protein n=1 Tax=Kribbella flavida (strain DSM 17836 / JCM 10339 / NBRC 14399) TaxID=479435 RepID=D2Q000_KRIFD|nr:DUF1992 domain-containing protein [Kribbella flavida]ADB29998.1 conserved hypothetical protein [Kribbella flavida DSM 17836]